MRKWIDVVLVSLIAFGVGATAMAWRTMPSDTNDQGEKCALPYAEWECAISHAEPLGSATKVCLVYKRKDVDIKELGHMFMTVDEGYSLPKGEVK